MDLTGSSITLPLLDPTLAVPLERPWEPPPSPRPPSSRSSAGVVLELAGGRAPDAGPPGRAAPTTERFASGLTTVHQIEARFLLDPEDPLSAAVETYRAAIFARDGWPVATTLRSRMTCDATSFIVAPG